MNPKSPRLVRSLKPGDFETQRAEMLRQPSLVLQAMLAAAAAFTCLVAMGYANAQVSDAATVENASNDNLLWLAGFTLAIGLAFGVWQLMKVRKAKRENAHSSLSAMADGKYGK